jgi:hypothetical protein
MTCEFFPLQPRSPVDERETIVFPKLLIAMLPPSANIAVWHDFWICLPIGVINGVFNGPFDVAIVGSILRESMGLGSYSV